MLSHGVVFDKDYILVNSKEPTLEMAIVQAKELSIDDKKEIVRDVESRSLELAKCLLHNGISDPRRQKEVAYLIIVRARADASLSYPDAEFLRFHFKIFIKDDDEFEKQFTKLKHDFPISKDKPKFDLVLKKDSNLSTPLDAERMVPYEKDTFINASLMNPLQPTPTMVLSIPVHRDPRFASFYEVLSIASTIQGHRFIKELHYRPVYQPYGGPQLIPVVENLDIYGNVISVNSLPTNFTPNGSHIVESVPIPPSLNVHELPFMLLENQRQNEKEKDELVLSELDSPKSMVLASSPSAPSRRPSIRFEVLSPGSPECENRSPQFILF